MESEKKAARVEIFFMRPESSALSLHHIKTTELFSRFGTPV